MTNRKIKRFRLVRPYVCLYSRWVSLCLSVHGYDDSSNSQPTPIDIDFCWKVNVRSSSTMSIIGRKCFTFLGNYNSYSVGRLSVWYVWLSGDLKWPWGDLKWPSDKISQIGGFCEYLGNCKRSKVELKWHTTQANSTKQVK